MYYLGDEIAVQVHDDNGNDTLDAGDYIEFYGQPVDSTFSKYAKYNVYWLTRWRCRYPHGRPLTAPRAQPPMQPPTRYTVRHELDQLYLMAGQGTDDIDRWVFSTVAFGDQIAHAQAGVARDFTINLPDVAGDNTVI